MDRASCLPAEYLGAEVSLSQVTPLTVEALCLR